MVESSKRSIAKTFSWRMFATLDTLILVSLFTGHISLALKVGALEIFTKMVLYFFHERVWSNIHWGITHKHNKKKK